MNKEMKEKWVEALRSGEYNQGKGRLRQANQYGSYYCCLGVLRDLYPNLIKGQNGALSPEDRKQIGISAIVQGKLINMNDGLYREKPTPFCKIADYIEKNL